MIYVIEDLQGRRYFVRGDCFCDLLDFDQPVFSMAKELISFCSFKAAFTVARAVKTLQLGISTAALNSRKNKSNRKF